MRISGDKRWTTSLNFDAFRAFLALGRATSVASWVTILLLSLVMPAWGQVSAKPGSADGSALSPRRIVSEADVGVGWLFLPLAQVCTTAGCVTPDTSFLFHLLGSVHLSERWALGLGGHFALWPTAVPPLSSNEQSVDRSVTRSYMLLTGQVRYFPWRKQAGTPRTGHFNPYLGGDLGMALLNDRYRSPSIDSRGALRIGEPGYNIHTEGLVARALLGADIGIGSIFALGLAVQGGALWFPQAKLSTLLDQATLQGTQLTLSGTISLKSFWQL